MKHPTSCGCAVLPGGPDEPPVPRRCQSITSGDPAVRSVLDTVLTSSPPKELRAVLRFLVSKGILGRGDAEQLNEFKVLNVGGKTIRSILLDPSLSAEDKQPFPEVALVGARLPSGAILWSCSGVLVHPRIVLTAAHAHQPPDEVVNVVALDVNDVGMIRPELHVRGCSAVRLSGIDVAVAVLDTPASIPPARIATSAEINTATHGTLVGFGEDLFLDPAFGTKRRAEIFLTALRRNRFDPPLPEEKTWGFNAAIEFCGGGGGFDSCDGDSGGPCYVRTEEGLSVAGITLRGTKRDPSEPRCGRGGVYARLDSCWPQIVAIAAKKDIRL